MTEQEYQAKLKELYLIEEAQLTLQKLYKQGHFSFGAGGTKPDNWISVTDTVYLYPMQYIEEALTLTQATVTRSGNQITTPTLADMDALFYDIWYRTFLALPKPDNPNAGGFSCAVGTQFTGSFNELEFRLSTGQLIMVWQEVTQVTDQADLPNSGDSPQGTVAYVPIWIDGDGNGVGGTITESMIGNFDPLRVVKI
jgi:hypothetical protein